MRFKSVLSIFCLVGLGYCLSLPVKSPAQTKGYNPEDIAREPFEKYAHEKGLTYDPEPTMLDSGYGGLQVKRLTNIPQKVNPLIKRLVYSELKINKGQARISSKVVTLGTLASTFGFTNRSANDPGFLSDAFWMNGNRTLVFKSGRYSEYDDYYLYAYKPNKKTVVKIEPRPLRNRYIAVSPDRRCIAYIVHGGPYGADYMLSGIAPLELWVWDSQTAKRTQIATGNSLQGTFSWKSSTELVFSKIESSEGKLIPNAYICNSKSGKISALLNNCRAPVFSPDGSSVAYSTKPQKDISYGIKNSVYVVRKLKTRKVIQLSSADLGSYSPNRQLMWSKNSKFIYSVIRQPKPGNHHILAYNITNRKSYIGPVIRPITSTFLLSSNADGRELYFLSQEPVGRKLNALGEADWKYRILVLNIETKRISTLFSRNRILGLSENGIELREK